MLKQSSMRRAAFVALIALSLTTLTPALAAVPVKPIVSVISAITKDAGALADDDIVRLARLVHEADGTKKVGKILGNQKLPNEVLEDTYLRIALQQKKLERPEAEAMYERLRGTEGFRTTLRKVVGNSEIKTAGHLNELRIADSATQSGFKVKGIGVAFDDGVKHAATDIDVLLQREGRQIAIEAKDYRPTTPIPMDSFRADMVSLVKYQETHPGSRVIPVFSLTHRPNDPVAQKLLEKEAARRNIQLIFGSPEQQIEQIQMLTAIL